MSVRGTEKKNRGNSPPHTHGNQLLCICKHHICSFVPRSTWSREQSDQHSHARLLERSKCPSSGPVAQFSWHTCLASRQPSNDHFFKHTTLNCPVINPPPPPSQTCSFSCAQISHVQWDLSRVIIPGQFSILLGESFVLSLAYKASNVAGI